MAGEVPLEQVRFNQVLGRAGITQEGIYGAIGTQSRRPQPRSAVCFDDPWVLRVPFGQRAAGSHGQ